HRVRPIPGDDRDADGANRTNPQAAAVEVDDRSDVAIIEKIDADIFADRFAEPFLRIGNLDPTDLRRGVKTVQMFVQPEYRWAFLGFISSNPFKNSGAIMKAVSGRVNA